MAQNITNFAIVSYIDEHLTSYNFGHDKLIRSAKRVSRLQVSITRAQLFFMASPPIFNMGDIRCSNTRITMTLIGPRPHGLFIS